MALSLSKPLDEVGAHQFIGSQIQATIDERGHTAVREREVIGNETTLLNSIAVNPCHERPHEV